MHSIIQTPHRLKFKIVIINQSVGNQIGQNWLWVSHHLRETSCVTAEVRKLHTKVSGHRASWFMSAGAREPCKFNAKKEQLTIVDCMSLALPLNMLTSSLNLQPASNKHCTKRRGTSIVIILIVSSGKMIR